MISGRRSLSTTPNAGSTVTKPSTFDEMAVATCSLQSLVAGRFEELELGERAVQDPRVGQVEVIPER
jgi:hypothetical protein